MNEKKERTRKCRAHENFHFLYQVASIPLINQKGWQEFHLHKAAQIPGIQNIRI